METIWGLVEIPLPFTSIIEKVAFYTSNGLYIGMVMAEGEIQRSPDVFFKDLDVTNAEIIKNDLLLCTINDQDGCSKLMTVEIEEEKTEVIIE